MSLPARVASIKAQRAGLIERRRRQRHVAIELELDAAGAEQDHRPDLGIEVGAEHELDARP